MSKRFLSIVLFALVLVLTAAAPLVGCGSPDDEQAAGEEIPEVCPDTGVAGDRYALSSELDEGREALGNQSVFTPDTAEIYATFWLSQDI